eukprot:1037064-Rhodomonas_salina.2
MDMTDARRSAGESGGACGRHCAKMGRIHAAMLDNASAVDASFIAMAQVTLRPGGGGSGVGRPCVVLEGNHRAVPFFLASKSQG